MKAAILSMVSILVLVLTGISVYSIYGRNIRSTELDKSLTNSIEESMHILYEEKGYEMKSNRELVGDFMANLCIQNASNSDITFEILNVDYERGILDIHATQKYKHFTGKEGTVTCRKTVILEEKKE